MQGKNVKTARVKWMRRSGEWGKKQQKKKKQIEKYKNHSTEIPWLRYL